MTNGNITLGRIGGIQVRINWSWLVIFALIVWSLADGVFPSQNPDLSDGVYLAMALVAALLFFASLLLHELGHAWRARREGIEIDGITLWLFGGVAQFKTPFRSAGAEFRVAVAGPAVSLLLGVGFVLIALAGLPSAVDGVAAWLGYINLILLVFNLIPALPLDGGRVLHAALWQARGDRSWATRVAATIGQGFGYLLIALGIAMFIFQGSFSGAWLAFVGWFLLQAASAEARHNATEAALDGLRVRDLMARDPVSVDGDLTVGDFMNRVAWSRRYTTYPVLGSRAAGRTPRVQVRRRPATLGVEYTTRARRHDPHQPGAAARRGHRGGGGARPAGLAHVEQGTRRRPRTPDGTAVDHRSRPGTRGTAAAAPPCPSLTLALLGQSRWSKVPVIGMISG